MKCKNCGCTIFNEKVKVCPNCGAKVKKKPSFLLVLLLVFLIMVGLGHLFTALEGSQASSSTSSGTSSSVTSVTTPTPTNSQPEDIKEISFQDFQWGSSVVDIAKRLNADYFQSVTPSWSAADDLMQASNYSLGYKIYKLGGMDIAGYTTLNFSMYCMYGVKDGKVNTEASDSELYLVTMNFDVADVEGTYDDLYTKLTNLYGSPKTSSHNRGTVSLSDGAYSSSVTTSEWKGANNTGIILSKCVPDTNAPDSADAFSRYVVLSYGKTDSDETLSAVYKLYRDYLTEQEKAERDPSNSSGL